LLVAVGLLIALGVLAGCGGSGVTSSASPSSSGPGNSTTAGKSSKPVPRDQALAIAADPSARLRYIPGVLRAKAGTVSMVFTNQSLLLHNLTVASKRGRVLGATPTFTGGSKTLTIKLKPGRYNFYCTVPGHRAAGMHGILIVS
jgi:plastocyanin